ncbi:glycosyltransferase family 2 protein [Salinimicrobium sp. TH3]|uniref:glycosyltransferase family 2 protein n=1 Tax=Salinimicrobium sp. TH3 TaxID=2997342 RepID=UPI0022758714|nr:glycosyltransferase [Salinimicrobium sp. TH3]MCY2687951.1 glycosyltransferase [Salinimicrobium sp. TH3]
MSLGLLVTNYNTAALTTSCIEHSLKYADAPIDQFVVIDDCSTEDYSFNFKEVEVIRNSRNLGLIKTLNRGLKNMHTDLILILDSDAWPLEDYVSGVKSYFNDNPEVGIATFQTVNSKGLASASYEAEPGALSLLLGQQLYRLYLNKILRNPRRINVFTCAMVVRKQVIKEIGNFDENFDWLELDHDLCMRATRKGWKIAVMPIRAFHKGSGTPQKVSDRVIRFYKNRWYLLKKFGKIDPAFVLVGAISFRLALEFILIWTIGFFYYRNLEEIKDKGNSRKALINYFLWNSLKGNNDSFVEANSC